MPRPWNNPRKPRRCMTRGSGAMRRMTFQPSGAGRCLGSRRGPLSRGSTGDEPSADPWVGGMQSGGVGHLAGDRWLALRGLDTGVALRERRSSGRGGHRGRPLVPCGGRGGAAPEAGSRGVQNSVRRRRGEAISEAPATHPAALPAQATTPTTVPPPAYLPPRRTRVRSARRPSECGSSTHRSPSGRREGRGTE
jgi:hypothetical protein